MTDLIRTPSVTRARVREAKINLQVLTRNRLQKVALAYVLLLVVMAVVGPYVAPHQGAIAGERDLEHKLQSPSLAYPFGTDEFGRDIFSRVLAGTRISVSAAAITVGLSLLIGIPLGAISGGLGGVVDDVIMRITDIFLSFPSVLLAIAIAAFLGPSLRNAIIAIVVSWWPWYTRLVRGVAMTVRERQFVRASRAMGTPRRRIVFRHVVPNAIGPTIVMASMDFGAVVLMMAALSFLGLGAQPPTPEWGLMVNQSRNYFLEAWWYMVFPGLAITFMVLAFNILGDGVREVLDPKSRNN